MYLEIELDKILKIKTNGRDDTNSNFVNYPYEPTPYLVLQNLCNSGYITKKDKVVDYGCGKGRVGFYIAYSNKAKVIGLEYDLRLYNQALVNKKNAVSGQRVKIINENASVYDVDDDITCAYFFNPFSIAVLKDVFIKLRESKKRVEREIKLFFYYPSNEYIDLIDREYDIIHIEDIDCSVVNGTDKREYIAVYKI